MTSEEDLAKERTQFLRRKALFSDLLETPAWKELFAIGAAQVERHIAELLEAATPEIDGMTHFGRSEYRKGAVYGIKLILSTPQAIIDTAKQYDRQPKEKSYDRPSQPVDDRVSDSDAFGPFERVTDLSGDQ